jgi:tyrosyl-tRNA synthetase
MNPMVPGLTGPKMSSSDADSKIDLLDDPATVMRKIKKAFCEEGNVADNGLLAFARMVLFPLLDGRAPLVFNRPEKFGGPVSYVTYAELEAAFASKALYPGDLKAGIADEVNKLLVPLRKAFESPEMQKLVRDAYPETVTEVTTAAAAAAATPKAEQQQQPKKAPKQQAPAPAATQPIDISRANIVVG